MGSRKLVPWSLVGMPELRHNIHKEMTEWD